ncbi:HK97 gp10 family phage protein [Aneurinibacillus thermoaerophilus]|uniref:HK97 gp10 family phage protein n=1 Tax=Aneurinibacillus thermoaerophilus TaxID=143495 RepID=UPI002E1ED020|nr:HK97 gp10 family phage protein [Aneurinibacillus thermoaerophilus]
MGFELEGLDIFERMLLQRVIREMPEKVERKLTELAFKYLAAVRPLTPWETGNLRNSIQVTEVKQIGDEFVIVVGTNVHYAAHVEYGHRIKRGTEYVGFVQGFHMFEIPLKQMEEWIDQDIKRWLQDIVEGRV